MANQPSNDNSAKEYECRRAELLAAIEKAEASLARGEGILVTPESMHDLAERITQRGRARLAARQSKKP